MRRAMLLPLAWTLACSRGVGGGAGASDDAPPRGAVTASTLAPAASGARLAPTSTPVEAGEATAPTAYPPPPVPTVETGPRPRPPRLHDGAPTLSSAGLPPEVVRRIVRQNFGRFRLCYEDGLRGDPTLGGEVKVRFVIDTDGAVSVASDAGSTLADPSVVTCVVRGFMGLSFPSPSAGSLVVVYPVYFAPGSP
jgi:hypothetical protein